MATAKKSTKEEAVPDDVYPCSTGLMVKVSPIPPMLLQKVMNSVDMPKRPTYEAKVGFGNRTEVWPMDEESAKDSPHGEVRWQYYEEETVAAQSIQNEKVTMAAFLFGTECEIPEDGWAVKQEYLGLDVPEDPDMRRAHYLATELPAEDIAGLMQAVMGQLQLPEELVADAEASFQRSIRSGPEGEG